MDYWDIAGFGSLYLEDSWVLDVRVSPGAVVLDCDLVLRPGHLLYREPVPGERYCYRRGRICFTSVDAINWREQPPASTVTRNATGEIDYDSIDRFTASDSGYRLVGGFGRMDVTTAELPFVDYA